MLITQIKLTKRGRYSLYTQDGFLCAIDGETLVKYNIKENSNISEFDLTQIVQSSDMRKAKDKALVYISRRSHSSGELYSKLTRVFDADTANAAIDEMRRLELVDDENFALTYAAQLLKKNKSKNEIIAALRQKGIEKNMALDAFSSLDASEQDACYNVLQKKYLNKLESGQKDKVIAALMRKGFSYGEIKNALERVSSELSGDYYEEY